MNEENYPPDIGGEECLTPGWDAISAYDGGGFYHFVTYGFSELYEKESENQEYSGYGFELRAVVDQKLTVPELAERVGTSLTGYSRAACV